jgi:hypothetical protein
MTDLSDVESVRAALAKACRIREARINWPTLTLVRHNWHPATVTNAATLARYGDEDAWEFIADCLERGCTIECNPPCEEFADHAYVMKESDGGDRRIYMKIAIGPAAPKKLQGLSFHYERY